MSASRPDPGGEHLEVDHHGDHGDGPGAGVPTIDVSPLLDPAADGPSRSRVGRELVDACTRHGFFQIVGHGVDPALRNRLLDAAATFFAQPGTAKEVVAMRHGGAAWRGWFPLGGELTSGVPDGKEGYYFGTELPADHPAVRAGRPLHGPNLFPEHPAELGPLVLEWMDRVSRLGRVVLSGIARGLGLDPDWFDRWTAEPTVLFRIFHYPPPPPDLGARWAVAEHTDYGLLTLLAQDDTGGLEVRTERGWVEVPPTPDAFVCNLGDMLERATGGRFRSTAHRVRLPERDRYSMPLFLDPGWDVEVAPLPGFEPTDADRAAVDARRWDGISVFDGRRTYGEYLLDKVSRVFPELFEASVRPPTRPR
jgi:isopenicillin N synthase-like dioxygenase